MSKDDIILEEANLNENEPMDEGLTADDFGGEQFIGNPQKDQTIIFTVQKVTNNPNIEVTKGDGTIFINGCSYKDPAKHGGKKGIRYDINTELGVYTVKPWEVLFKLFSRTKDKEGLLMKYAASHSKRFEGAKISITRLVDTGHASIAIPDLMKIIGKNEAETKKYKEEVIKARDESRCFDVKLID